MSPSTKSSPAKQKTLYFAYGSNLHLEQMARRCPNSTYIGRAILNDFRWQINERGYANVVSDKSDIVHGLVYELDGDDEACLDRNEGVAIRCYSKAYYPVSLFPPSPLLYRRPVKWIVENGGPQSILESAGEAGGDTKEGLSRLESDVLVYVSFDFVTDSKPRDEYIDRINFGIADAVALGADDCFFDKTVRHYIPKRQPRLKPIPYQQQERDATQSSSAPGNPRAKPSVPQSGDQVEVRAGSEDPRRHMGTDAV